MNISLGILNKISFIYLIFHLLLFCAGWLNIPTAAITISALICIIVNILKGKALGNKNFYISKINIALIIILSALWCYTSGIGGLFFQMHDWPFRNAVMRDLISFNWPVIYDNGSALCYYFGFMLPSALLGKFVYMFNGHKLENAFNLADLFCLFWSATGTALSFFHIVVLTNTKKFNAVLVCFMFVFFSGLDIFIKRVHDSFWHPPVIFSNNIYNMISSYHITIPVILTTFLLVHNRKKISEFGTLILLFLFFCPPTAVGTVLYFLGYIIESFIKYLKHKRLNIFLSQCFKVKNILSLIVILPVIYLFYKSNYAAATESFFFLKHNLYILKCIALDSGIFLLLFSFFFYKKTFLYAALIYSLIVPICCIKTDFDFCWRAIYPTTIIISLIFLKMIFSCKLKPALKILFFIIYIPAFLSSFPYLLFVIKLNDIEGIERKRDDYIGTYNNTIEKNAIPISEIGDQSNYGAIEPYNYTFWKYLAKQKQIKTP